jgi:opacity protein-like surface antigen
MKKTALTLGFLLALAGVASAQKWEAGISGGYRTIKDPVLRATYGNGIVYTPFLSLALSKSLRIGAEYEFGYVKDAAIGLFQDPSSLDVQGGHLFLQYGDRIGRVQPFLKVGVGLYSYKFDVDMPALPGLKIENSDVSFYFGAGLRLIVSKRFFATTEFKYAALWVDPFNDQIDLGGIRALLGIGIAL